MLFLVLLLGTVVATARLDPQRSALVGAGGVRSLEEIEGVQGAEQPIPETLIPDAANAQQRAAYAPVRVERLPAQSRQPPKPYLLRWRVGVGVPDGNPLYFDWLTHRPGWYLNWTTDDGAGEPSRMEPAQELGMDFVPMVRVKHNRLTPPVNVLRVQAARNPGRVWLIGNEPDVPWQDGVTPEQYVMLYHQAHQAITSVDPTARLAIGGISQVTPLRLAYLDRVWDGYRNRYGVEMPVDVWTMHAFVLREQADSWGVGIPPGFEQVQQGTLWDVSDHDDLDLVADQVRRMRVWMADRGQRQKPLYITEYGVLIPESFGFTPSRVVAFLVGSYDLFASLRDPALGYAADDHRLVQRWVWFSTRDPLYPTGDLFDMEGAPLPVARAINGYLRTHADGSDLP